MHAHTQTPRVHTILLIYQTNTRLVTCSGLDDSRETIDHASQIEPKVILVSYSWKTPFSKYPDIIRTLTVMTFRHFQYGFIDVSNHELCFDLQELLSDARELEKSLKHIVGTPKQARPVSGSREFPTCSRLTPEGIETAPCERFTTDVGS